MPRAWCCAGDTRAGTSRVRGRCCPRALDPSAVGFAEAPMGAPGEGPGLRPASWRAWVAVPGTRVGPRRGCAPAAVLRPEAALAGNQAVREPGRPGLAAGCRAEPLSHARRRAREGRGAGARDRDADRAARPISALCCRLGEAEQIACPGWGWRRPLAAARCPGGRALRDLAGCPAAAELDLLPTLGSWDRTH